jgi:hypothetical protein
MTASEKRYFYIFIRAKEKMMFFAMTQVCIGDESCGSTGAPAGRVDNLWKMKKHISHKLTTLTCLSSPLTATTSFSFFKNEKRVQ